MTPHHPLPARPGLRSGPAALRAKLRRSMTAQIGLAVTLVATLLVSGSSALMLWLPQRELRDLGDALMLATLSAVQDELRARPDDAAASVQAALAGVEQHVSRMHLAVYDAQMQPLAATAGFAVPVSAWPARTVDVDRLPQHLHSDVARVLRRTLGDVTRAWTSPAGVRLLVMTGELSLREPASPRERRVVVVALDTKVVDDLQAQGLGIIATAVLLSALLSAALGVLLAQRIVVAARGFGAAAGRIGAQDLGERLDLARLPTELHDAALAVNHMLDRLQGAFSRLREFSVDLAHDLRTPIHNLLGEAQVALSRPRDGAEYRAVLESAVEDYERMARLIENLLFLARSDDQPLPLQPEWLDLRDVCQRAADYFEALADEAGLTVAVATHDAAAPVPWVWADRLLLIRALGNLMTNALRHASRPSTVTLACSAGPDGAQLMVSNVGEAIPPALQQRIFDRLFRVDSARGGATGGSGLGLAIVRSVMQRHGGQVLVHSQPGEPTTFTLHFPAAPPGTPEPQAAATTATR